MLVMSMVRFHQCMNPATSMQVNSTHIITKMDPRQLPRVIRVVKNIQTENVNGALVKRFSLYCGQDYLI